MTQSTAPGVIVQTQSNSIDRHPSAVKIYVVDGHLYVKSNQTDIAVYAPGSWTRAKHANTEVWEQPTR